MLTKQALQFNRQEDGCLQGHHDKLTSLVVDSASFKSTLTVLCPAAHVAAEPRYAFHTSFCTSLILFFCCNFLLDTMSMHMHAFYALSSDMPGFKHHCRKKCMRFELSCTLPLLSTS
jgi:hypothetical protein